MGNNQPLERKPNESPRKTIDIELSTLKNRRNTIFFDLKKEFFEVLYSAIKIDCTPIPPVNLSSLRLFLNQVTKE